MARRNGAMPIIGIFAMMFALLPGTALAETTLRVWTPWPSYTTIFDKLTAEFHRNSSGCYCRDYRDARGRISCGRKVSTRGECWPGHHYRCAWPHWNEFFC